MPAGVYVESDAGSVQITSDMPNLSIRHVFHVNEPGTPVWTVVGQVSTRVVWLDFDAITPVVAYTGGPSTVAVAVLESLGGQRWRVRVYSDNISTVKASVYVYDRIVTRRVNYGLELFDEGGTCTYSSSAGAMKVVAVRQDTQLGGGATIVVPEGRRYAVVASRLCTGIRLGIGYQMRGCHNEGYSAPNWMFSGRNIVIPQSDNNTNWNQTGLFFVVDVTGL